MSDVASMEPCVVTHGNVVGIEIGIDAGRMLQWSHAWLRMEIYLRAIGAPTPMAASMEPCVVTHGNSTILVLHVLPLVSFNGAMRGYAWK